MPSDGTRVTKVGTARPWDHDDSETDRAFLAFTSYLSLGPHRSLRAASDDFYGDSEGHGASAAQLRQFQYWSSAHNWVQRTNSYDANLARRRLSCLEDEQLAADLRHLELARAFQEKIARRLAELDPQTLTPMELAKWLEVSVKLERLALGAATERTESVGSDPSIRFTQLILAGAIPDAVVKELGEASQDRVLEILEARVGDHPQVRALLEMSRRNGEA